MKTKVLHRLRNIGIAAHIDAGKTTLTERILYYTGKIHRIGETHDGGSQMDTQKMEKDKGITISAAATQVNWKWKDQDYTFNIIDTPGHVDFTIEVERALRVLDGMIALFDAVAGVEPQSETVWRQANRYHVPRIAFVNKMDRMGADFEKVVAEIEDRLNSQSVALQIPIGSEDTFSGVIDLVEMKAIEWVDEDQFIINEIPEAYLEEANQARRVLLETLAGVDEVFFSLYLDEETVLTTNEIMNAIRRATLSLEIVPVLCGTAYKNKGVQPLMDAVAAYLPAPSDTQFVEGLNPETKEEVQISTTITAPFTGLAFKIAFDQQNRKLAFIRLYSGSIKTGQSVLNMRTGAKQRMGHLYLMHSNKQVSIQKAEAGDIIALVGMKDIRTGDTLVAEGTSITLESLFIPEPVIGVALEPKQTADLDKLSIALHKLGEEDPTFRVNVNAETGQTIIEGMGELHLEYLVSRIQDDFKIPCIIGEPMVSYREELTQTIRHRERLKKFTGGPGLFAEIEVEIGPADVDYILSDAFEKDQKRLQFVNEIVGGAIPKEYISSVEKGFQSMMNQGIVAGYPLEHMKVRLVDGKTHVNESKPLAFELVAKETFKIAAPMTKPQLLEPMMLVEVSTAEEYMGNIIGDLNRRRGIIKGQNSSNGLVVIKADVPLSEMFGYIGQLRALSAGRGTFTMIFSHYAAVPEKIAQAIETKEKVS